MSDHQHSQTIERLCDVAVIGGSAAGLAAALQIVRQQRSVLVIDDGTPRNQPALHMHAYLGFDGAAPGDLTAAGRTEVRSYGGEVLSGRVLQVEQSNDRFHLHLSGGHTVLARRVLLATGLVDELPPVDGLAEHWGTSVINCPFCHGYEVRGRRVVQLATHAVSVHTIPLWRDLAGKLTVLVPADGISDQDLDEHVSDGVEVMRGSAVRVLTDPSGMLSGIETDDGLVIDADAVVVTPGLRVRSEVVDGLDVAMVEHASGLCRSVEVDAMGATSVPGLYAAGNVTNPTQQVLPAAAHGSQVGAALAMSLAAEGPTNSQTPNDWDHRYSGDQIWSGNPNGTLVQEVNDLAPGNALDVGAGEGADAIWLAQHGCKVTATDVSAQALAKVSRHALDHQVEIEVLHRDAAALGAFPRHAFDLVSMQYGAIPRSPDQRGLHNLMDAVAPGGTLLVVAHDLEPMRQSVDPAEQTMMWDADAFVGVDEFASAVQAHPDWVIECLDKRSRPHGAATSHHVEDVVLRARRAG